MDDDRLWLKAKYGLPPGLNQCPREISFCATTVSGAEMIVAPDVTARMKAQREKMRLAALELRVGIHTGPVISGVVGRRKFTFDIWGDAVNTAALMEANGASGRIN